MKTYTEIFERQLEFYKRLQQGEFKFEYTFPELCDCGNDIQLLEIKRKEYFYQASKFDERFREESLKACGLGDNPKGLRAYSIVAEITNFNSNGDLEKFYRGLCAVASLILVDE